MAANNIIVAGVDDSGNILIAWARDEGSISNPIADNYVGEVRTYILISQSINTQASANAICAILFSNLTQARTHLTFVLPDYYPQLGIGAELTVAGYWNGAVESIEAELSEPRIRRTVISVLKGV